MYFVECDCVLSFLSMQNNLSWVEVMEDGGATQPHKIPLQLAESWRSNWDPLSVFIFLPVNVNISEAGGLFSNLGVRNTQPPDRMPENSTQMESRGSVRVRGEFSQFPHLSWKCAVWVTRGKKHSEAAETLKNDTRSSRRLPKPFGGSESRKHPNEYLLCYQSLVLRICSTLSLWSVTDARCGVRI